MGLGLAISPSPQRRARSCQSRRAQNEGVIQGGDKRRGHGSTPTPRTHCFFSKDSRPGRSVEVARTGILVRCLSHAPRPSPEDAFLGTTDPRAGRLGRTSGECDQPKWKPPGCEPGGVSALSHAGFADFAAVSDRRVRRNIRLGGRVRQVL
jgi:hypothetical protein